VAQPLSNYREVLAYAVAHAIRISTIWVLSSLGLLAPLYRWAYSSGGSLAVLPVSFGLSLIWMGLALPLFLVVRGIIGGVPPIVAGPGREETVTSNGAEIGAYVLAHLIGIVAVMLLNSAVLSMVYATLYRAGSRGSATALGIGISVVSTALVFLVFVALRRGFSAASSPGRA
jgi:hypothetical protein